MACHSSQRSRPNQPQRRTCSRPIPAPRATCPQSTDAHPRYRGCEARGSRPARSPAPQPHTTPAHSAADASMLVWVEHPGSGRPSQPPRNEDSTVAPNVPERTLRFQACRSGGRLTCIGALPHPCRFECHCGRVRVEPVFDASAPGGDACRRFRPGASDYLVLTADDALSVGGCR